MMPHDNPSPPPASFKLAPLFGVALATLMIAAIGIYALRSPSAPWGECEPSEFQEENGPIPLDKWTKPLAALVLTGQMHGYSDPCGCSYPQHGGLPRRYNFVESLKAKQWDVVGIDLGELAQIQGIPEQNVLKFDMSVRALRKMNYRAFGIGADEILLPLGNGLASIWEKTNSHPRPINMSLADAVPGKDLHDELNVRPYEIIDSTNPKIGVINMMGPEVRAKLGNQQKFLNNLEELPKALKAFADAKVEIAIILHHEYPNKDDEPEGYPRDNAIDKERRVKMLKVAKECAELAKANRKIPPVLLAMMLTTSSEAPSLLKTLDPSVPTQFLEVGHKGKYVGLLGIYAGEKTKYRLQYLAVQMTPEWESPDDKKKDNPVIALMEQYNENLKRHDMLAKYPRRSPHPNQAGTEFQKGLKANYVGSERCGDCHDHAHKVWAKTKHAHATETLEGLKYPSKRQFDPECMKCHTTGFQYPGGYYDLVSNIANWPAKPKEAPSAKKIETHNKNLRGIGCESCHGPGSEHVKNKDNKAIHELINNFRPSDEERKLEGIAKKAAPEQKVYDELLAKRMSALGLSCMKCHNEENDVNWGDKTKKKDTIDNWLRLIHRTPKNNNGVNAPLQPPVIEIIADKKQ